MRISVGMVLGGLGFLLPVLAPGSTFEYFQRAVERFLSEGLAVTLLSLVAVLVVEAQIRILGIDNRVVSKLTSSETKTALALIPGVLGFLPSVAGARLSVGLVRILGSRVKSSDVNLAVVNFWFRHVSIFCNPLIAGTILAIGLTNLPAHELLWPGLSFSVAFSLSGWICFVRSLKNIPLDSNILPNSSENRLTPSEWCFFATIPMSLFFALFLPGGLILAHTPVLVVGMLAVSLRLGFRSLARLFTFSANDCRIFLEIVLIFWFVAMADVVGLTSLMATSLLNSMASPLLALIFASFLVTMVTGLCLPSVALIMPIATNLYPDDGLFLYSVLLSGFVAQFVTPAHLCLVVSTEAFGTRVSSVVLRLVPALLLSLALGSLCLLPFL